MATYLFANGHDRDSAVRLWKCSIQLWLTAASIDDCYPNSRSFVPLCCEVLSLELLLLEQFMQVVVSSRCCLTLGLRGDE